MEWFLNWICSFTFRHIWTNTRDYSVLSFFFYGKWIFFLLQNGQHNILNSVFCDLYLSSFLFHFILAVFVFTFRHIVLIKLFSFEKRYTLFVYYKNKNKTKNLFIHENFYGILRCLLHFMEINYNNSRLFSPNNIQGNSFLICTYLLVFLFWKHCVLWRLVRQISGKEMKGAQQK